MTADEGKEPARLTEPHRLTQAELVDFVDKYCSGRIRDNNELSARDIPLAFLPVYFGVLKDFKVESIGLIYAVAGEDRTCGMGVNGFPVFFSCRILHAEDWARLKPAIKAEFERRKKIEV